jgi:hypothetical protein
MPLVNTRLLHQYYWRTKRKYNICKARCYDLMVITAGFFCLINAVLDVYADAYIKKASPNISPGRFRKETNLWLLRLIHGILVKCKV